MIFRQLQDSTSSTYTYIIAATAPGLACIIDPVQNHVAQYLEVLKSLQLTLKYVLDTHVHADHITGSGKLKQETGCLIAMDSHAKAEGIDIRLTDQQTLTLDTLSMTSLYTPGHTDDSACFLFEDRIFTGDTLFINGSGRTDFQHGSAQDSYRSITQKIFTLRDDILVYPGHDYKGRMVSTIGEEKRFNPRLANKTEAEYIEIMTQLNLPKPQLIDVAVPANLTCGL